MPAMPKITEKTATQEIKVYPDQEEKTIPRTKGKRISTEQYLALRLRVENGEVSVVGIRAVDGPLTAPERLHGGLAYEVTRDQKRIETGSIPDSGVRRGFPNPEGGAEMAGHALFESRSFEFTARVRRHELSRAALPKTRVTIYRIKGEAPSMPLGPELLSVQFKQEVRQVAQLDGINPGKLPEALQKELAQALR